MGRVIGRGVSEDRPPASDVVSSRTRCGWDRHLQPTMKPVETLTPGEVGYYLPLVSRPCAECRVGDTGYAGVNGAPEPLPGGLQAGQTDGLRRVLPVPRTTTTTAGEALENCSERRLAWSFEPETSQALNFGSGVGFLGLFSIWKSSGAAENGIRSRHRGDLSQRRIQVIPAAGEVSHHHSLPISRPSTIDEIANPGWRSRSFLAG